jgi:uncharacterized protein YjgD (DUF1641 family)
VVRDGGNRQQHARIDPRAQSRAVRCRNRYFKVIFVPVFSLLLAGCSGAYLHRPALATTTAQIKTDFASLPAPAFLAEQKSRLEEYAGQEDRALVDFLVASRDYSLLNVMHPAGGLKNAGSASTRLQRITSDELMLLVGQASLDNQTSKRVQTAPYVEATRQSVVPFLARQLASRAQDYRTAGGGRSTDCSAVLQNSTPATEDGADAVRAYSRLVSVCRGVEAVQRTEPDCALQLGGELSAICNRIEALKKQADEGKEQTLKKQVAALQELATGTDDPLATAKIRDLLNSAEAVADQATTLTSDERTQHVLELLNKAFSINLQSELDQLGQLPKAKKVTQARDSLLRALHLIDAIHDVRRKPGSPLDEPSALLIGLAKTQHDLNMARIDVQEQRSLVGILRQEASAVRNAVFFLARAQSTLCQGTSDCVVSPASLNDPAVAEALGYYVNAVNQGTIPYDVLKFREVQLIRSTSVSRAQLAESDYRALVQPAIDQIAAYGAGGIKPETLGPLLGGIPVTGAIIGK